MKKLASSSSYAVFRNGDRLTIKFMKSKKVEMTNRWMFLAGLGCVGAGVWLCYVAPEALVFILTFFFMSTYFFSEAFSIINIVTESKKKAKQKSKNICSIKLKTGEVYDEKSKKVGTLGENCHIIREVGMSISRPAYALSTPKGNYTILPGKWVQFGYRKYKQVLVDNELIHD